MALGKNIKGITIEFAGDTTKLGKAIKDIDKKTRSLDQQLKQVNKALKFNPGNTELLAQKQQLLGKKIEETKNRLNALREAQAKMDEDPSVDKTSEDYMALRREIIETESKLKHFEAEMKKLQQIKFEQLGKRVEDVGRKMKTVGDNMTKYVTLPITAAGAGAVKAFKEVDAGLDVITQKTGATGKALEGMKDSAKKLAQEIPTDFETAGSAVGEVSTRFGLTGQALEDLSGKFIKFAKLNNTDVSTSIDSVQKAMAAYGLKAEQAGDYLDVLNKAGQDTGIGVDQLADSLVTNAAAMQAMGFSAEKSAFFIAQLEKSGVDSAAALGGLQKALVNGAKEGKTMGEVLEEIQGSIVNAGSDTEALAAATEIFGAKAAPKMATALRNGALDLDALASSATDAAGSVENTFNDTLDPADKFTMAMNSLKVTGYEVGATLLESFAPAIEKVAGYLKTLAEKWNSLSPGMQDTIIKAALVTAALGPVVSILGRLTIGIGGLITKIPLIISGISKISTAFNALRVVMLANPWAIVAAAAVAAIVLIVKNWDTIKEFFTNLWTALKEIFTKKWEEIKKVITGVWDAIKKAATVIWNGLKTFFTAWLTAYKKLITAAFTAVKTTITKIWTGIKTAATTAWNAIKSAVTKPISALRTWLSTTWSGIRDRAKQGFQKIKDAITAPIQKAKEVIKGIIDKIKSFFSFKVSLPHIKLPHFYISPRGWQLGDLLEGVIPSLGIDWYAKGGIFKSPTVVGVGEAGPEAAVPLDPFWAKMDKMIESVEGAGGGDDITINVYGTPGMDVRQLADEVERRLARAQRKKESVWT